MAARFFKKIVRQLKDNYTKVLNLEKPACNQINVKKVPETKVKKIHREKKI